MSANPVSSIPLTGPPVAGNDIFGFDGDGICGVTPRPAACPFGPTGYEGPGVSFGSINATKTTGVVTFNPPIRPNGGTAYFGLEAAIPTTCPDADGDGLCDDWERNGLTVTIGGVPVFVNLPAMGADPNHKDIFIQADYMVQPGTAAAAGHTHKPNLAGVNIDIQAFAKAPVANPDGTTGINLHVDCGPTCVMNPKTGATWGALSRAHSLAHQTTLGTTDASGNYLWAAFQAIKTANFTPTGREQAFHYVVFAHNLGNLDGTSGISRGITASDFIVSLGSWPGMTGTTLQQGGTLMHELGHNLSLLHGGTDSVNYKPNYLSVMGYLFQTGGLVVGGVQSKFDYSRFLLPSLDENNLNEIVGLNGGAPIATYGTLRYCPGAANSSLIANANGNIDWNCNGAITNGVAADINRDGNRTVLTTFNDWPNLVYNGGSVGGLGIAVIPPMQTPQNNDITPAIDGTVIKAQQVTVSSPGVIQLSAGGAVDLIYTIANIGAQDDTYTLAASASSPWADLSGVPASIFVAAGGSQSITLHLVVPAATAAGTSATLTLNAVSASNSAVEDTGTASIDVVGGKPRIVASILNQTTTGNTVVADVQISNQGPGLAVNTVLTSLTAKAIGGSGAITVNSPSVPVTVGDIAVGGSAVVTVTLTLPASVTRFSLVEGGTVADSSGAAYAFSVSEVVQK